MIDGTTPIHNLAIGMTRVDTPTNAKDVLALVEELFLVSDGRHHRLEFNEHTATGMIYVLSCVMDALNFEKRYHR